MNTAARLTGIRESLYAMLDALEESRRALARDASLGAREKKAKREAIRRRRKKLELQEARINLAALQRREQDASLDALIGRLNGAVGEATAEIDRMRRATAVAGNVTKVLSAATTMLGIVARIIA
ncbi:MAG: hypothetical protein HKM95_05525 [Inquilinus sp.]|nr:hypothetical protein [Inquilinus sp.]